MSVVEPRNTNEPADGHSPTSHITELIKHAIESSGRTSRLAVLLLAASGPVALTIWIFVQLGTGQ